MPVGKSNGTKETPVKQETADPFKLVQLTGTTRRNILMSISGATSTRKSSLGLSAPDPIAIFDFDNGLEYVMDRYAAKTIYRIGDEDGENILAVIAKEDKIENQKQADVIWSRVKATYYDVLANPEIKTVIIDTGTHLWEIAQWSEMGRIAIERADKEKDVLPFHYGEVNQQFRALFQQAIRSKKNVIFTHREKEEWDAKGPTGKMQLHGWKHTEYEVEVSLVSSMFGTGQKTVQNILVTKCRINQEKEGTVYSGAEQCQFAYIASDIIGTPIDDWR